MNDILTHRVRASPDATALIAASGREWTYTELDRAVERTAGRLSALGLAPGDHLGILLETRPASVGIIHAAARLGCVLVPLNTRLTVEELRPQVERADLAALVCETTTEAAATAIGETTGVPVTSVDDTERVGITELDSVEPVSFKRASWTATDPALMLYTSGTTGEPKLVVLTLKNLLASAVASAFRLGVSPDDRWLNPLSVYHMGGFAPVFRSVLYGTAVVLTGGFAAETTLDALDSHGCTGVSLVPTMLRRVLDAGTLPDSLRFVLLGGAPTPDELVERCARRNVPVYPTYGMTETASQVATARPDEAFAHSGTVGRPLLGTDLTVLDSTGNPLEANETGELVVSGPTVFERYDDPDATAAAFSEHGFHTGDIGYRDEGSRVWVTGRRDDRISTGGELVDPNDVAATLRDHPSVRDAAVVGLSDPEWGERVGALVVTETHLDVEQLREYCREHLAGFKVPRTVAFTDSLPRTASGTIERETVREHLRERDE